MAVCDICGAVIIQRLDPMAVSEEVIDTPLEIVAFGGNTKAFDLLSPHYEENTKKQIAQLLIWALNGQGSQCSLHLALPISPLGRGALRIFREIERDKTVTTTGEQLHHTGLQLTAESSRAWRHSPPRLSAPAGVASSCVQVKFNHLSLI